MTDYRRGGNWKDHAVLYRMNAQSNALEMCIRDRGGSVTLRHVAQQPRKVFEAAGVGRMMTID